MKKRKKMINIIAKNNDMRGFDDLLSKEKSIVTNKIHNFNYKSAIEINDFGKDDINGIREFLEFLLKTFNNLYFIDFNKEICDFINYIQLINMEDFLKKHKRIFSNAPYIGIFVKRQIRTEVNKTITTYISIQSVIENFETKIEQIRLESMKKMKLINKMRQEIYKLADIQELNYITIKKVEDEILNNNKFNDSQTLYSKLKDKANLFKEYRVNILQIIPYLIYMYNVFEIIVNKIQNIIDIISQWKKQFALNVWRFYINNSNNISETITIKLRQIYTKNGLNEKDLVANVTINIEDFKQLHDQIVLFCVDFKSVGNEGKNKIRDLITKINEVQQNIS